MVFILALGCCVLTANVGTNLINSAEVVFSQKIAIGMNKKKPLPLFHKNSGVFMQEKPSHVVIVTRFLWSINGKSKITATLCGTILTKVNVFLNLFPPRSS
jgi:hypothetical protein